jgi:hypothetical protein
MSFLAAVGSKRKQPDEDINPRAEDEDELSLSAAAGPPSSSVAAASSAALAASSSRGSGGAAGGAGGSSSDLVTQPAKVRRTEHGGGSRDLGAPAADVAHVLRRVREVVARAKADATRSGE